jgi:hypothetical protein
VSILFVARSVDPQQWKSNLKDAGVTVSKFLQPLNCELVNSTSPYQCSSWDVTEENVSALLSTQAQSCAVTLNDWGRQMSHVTSVSAASSGQHISEPTAEDNACKQFLGLHLQGMVYHEILIFFNQLNGYDIWTCYALFLLQWVQCTHMSQLPFKPKKFKYPGALISHCARVSDLEIYHLTG